MANKRNRRRGNNTTAKNLVEGKIISPRASIPDIVSKPWFNTIVYFMWEPPSTGTNQHLTLKNIALSLATQIGLNLACTTQAIPDGDASRAYQNMKLKIRGFEFWSMPENLATMNVHIYSLEPSIAATTSSNVMTVEYPVLKNMKDSGTRVSPARIGYWHSASQSSRSLSANLDLNVASFNCHTRVVGHVHVLWKLEVDTVPPNIGKINANTY
jgi:hypothetical protein